MHCSSAALHTLVRLRFVAVLVQLLALAVARLWLTPHLRYWPLLILVLTLAATNVALWLRLRTLDNIRYWATAVVLLDVGLLTALLALSGGAHNPFTALYLVHVALTAMLLGPWEVTAVLLTSALGYASLFFWYVPLPACLGGHAADGSGFSVHLHGMWVAFVLAGAATAGFMYRMALAIQRERETSERHARLLGLATLAAGAAHEIGNPLSTIKVAATELSADLRARGDEFAPLAKDAELIASEVVRAWQAVRGLGTSAGELSGEPSGPIVLSELIERLQNRVQSTGVELVVRNEHPSALMRLPTQTVVTALVQVVRNAIQASPIGAIVELDAVLSSSQLRVRVQDRGPGIAPEIRDRIGEPFVTTKEPGRGMGLGLFVTRSLVERLGGVLQIGPRAGGGTSVTIRIPTTVVV